MWKRRTYHDCAEELLASSREFRAAYKNQVRWDHSRCDQVMRDTSMRGIELLRILALSIRGDQDSGLTARPLTSVGALKSGATQAEILAAIRDYRPPYAALSGFTPICLRTALNKIAHARPTPSGFFADDTTHDLILSGVYRDVEWIAIVSVIDLCAVIQSIPDVSLKQ